MAEINFNPGERLYRARKTIAFDGTAGNGAVGTVTVFTITGRVAVLYITAFCTENLTSDPTPGGATIALGTANRSAKFIGSTTAENLDINEWWVDGTPLTEAVNIINQTTNGADPSQMNVVCSANIVVTVGTDDVTDGTIIFDVWYYPVTDGASLA